MFFTRVSGIENQVTISSLESDCIMEILLAVLVSQSFFLLTSSLYSVLSDYTLEK